jgi:flagellar basal body-associated protein FliL
MDRTILKIMKQAKRLIIIVIGFTVLLVGIAMIVLLGLQSLSYRSAWVFLRQN